MRGDFISNRPHTTTTFEDIKRMFRKHPAKTALAVPVATLFLGIQMALYFVTVPFAAFNGFLSNF